MIKGKKRRLRVHVADGDMPKGVMFKLGAEVHGRKVVARLESEDGMNKVRYKVLYSCGHTEYIHHASLRKAYVAAKSAEGCLDCRSKIAGDRINQSNKDKAAQRGRLAQPPKHHSEDQMHRIWNQSLGLSHPDSVAVVPLLHDPAPTWRP